MYRSLNPGAALSRNRLHTSLRVTGFDNLYGSSPSGTEVAAIEVLSETQSETVGLLCPAVGWAGPVQFKPNPCRFDMSDDSIRASSFMADEKISAAVEIISTFSVTVGDRDQLTRVTI